MSQDFLRIESYRKGVFYSTTFNALAKSIGFVNNLAVAFYFGAQANTDVYFYSLATILAVTGFLTNLNSAVLIPESMRLRIQRGAEESMSFVNLFLLAYCCVGIAIGGVVMADPVGLYTVFSRFDSTILRSNLIILQFSAPLFFLVLITSFLNDVLTSLKFFTVPMIAGAMNSAICLVSIVSLQGSLGTTSIVIGMTCGYASQMLLQLILMKWLLGWSFKTKLPGLSRRLAKNIMFAQTGNFATILSGYVPMFLFSGFSSGVIAALNYGQKVVDVPTALFTVQLSAVVGIKLNEHFAKGETDSFSHAFTRTGRIMMLFLVPLSVTIFLFSDDVVTILFRRGAFDKSAVALTSIFLRYLILLLPLYAINTLVARVFMASQKIKEAFRYQVFMNVLLICGVVLGVRQYGVLGYPIALLSIYSLNVFFLQYLLRRYFPSLPYRQVSVPLLIFAVVSGILGYFALQIREMLGDIGIVTQLALMAATYLCCFSLGIRFLLPREYLGQIRALLGKGVEGRVS